MTEACCLVLYMQMVFLQNADRLLINPIELSELHSDFILHGK